MPDTITTQSAWQEFRDELLAFIRRRVRQEADAEDVLQKTFLNLHRHLSTSPPPEHLRAWLHQVARNAITDSLRSRPADQSLDALPADPPDDPQDDAITEKLSRCLSNLVQTLPPDYRDALTLTDLGGLNQSKAAARAGLSPSGMKSRVQRGREQLHQALLACCSLELDHNHHPIDMTCRKADTCRDCS